MGGAFVPSADGQGEDVNEDSGTLISGRGTGKGVGNLPPPQCTARDRRKGRAATHLDADHDDEGGGHGDGKGLVVGQVGVVAKDPVGDEEHEDGGVDALGDADEELPLIEKEVQLARFIEFGVLQAAVFRHILGERGGEGKSGRVSG